MGDMILYRSTNGFGSDIADLKKYKVMSVVINEEDSNPGTSCTYADDAVDMVWGATDEAIAKWQEFFQYRPCLFAGGELRGYLNPNDYTKFEDGSPSGITTSNYSTRDCVDTTGKYLRVAIEIPKMGFCISRSGSTLKVSLTNYPNKEGYSYKAFLYNGTYYDHLYVDAGVLNISEDHDLSDGTDVYLLAYPGCLAAINTVDLTKDSKYAYTKEKVLNKLRSNIYGDSNRHFLSFYEYTLLQCMSILQLKTIAGYYNIFVEDLLGDMGLSHVDDMSPIRPSSPFYRTDRDYYDGNYRTYWKYYCLFGIDKFSVTTYCDGTDAEDTGILIDGIMVTGETTISLATNGRYSETWDDTTLYDNFTVFDMFSSNMSRSEEEYVKYVYGNNDLGFIPKTFGASSSTYWSSFFEKPSSTTKNKLPLGWIAANTIYTSYNTKVSCSNIFNTSLFTLKPGVLSYNDVFFRATTLL